MRNTLAAIALALCGGIAQAQSVEPEPAPKPPPSPYSLPWQLRPTGAASAVRSDTAFAFYQSPTTGQGGFTAASMLLVSYKVMPNLAPLLRFGFVSNSPPGGTGAGSALVNPVLGATYAVPLSQELRLGLFLGVALPMGMGGGNARDAATFNAVKSGVLARSAMDNAMFAVNDLTVFPGVGLSFTRGRLTLQVEATVLELLRARGEAVQSDTAKTNFTSGLHVGYFVHPMLSLSAELRYQQWIIPPAGTSRAALNNLTVAVGPRLHVKLADGVWARPGLAYATALDAPMTASNYQIVQLDVPISF